MVNLSSGVWCLCVHTCFCNTASMPRAGCMQFPIVRAQDQRAPCSLVARRSRMTFLFTSCLQNVAWCCLICGLCPLLTCPFVGGRAEPWQGACGLHWHEAASLRQNSNLGKMKGMGPVWSLCSRNHHQTISIHSVHFLGSSVKRLFITSVMKAQFSKSTEIRDSESSYSASCMVPATMF